MVRWIVTMIIAVATIFATIDVVAADVIPISGDLDGDGIDIYGTFNSISATFTFNGKTVSYGLQTDLPIVGDWDNDGKDEIGVFRPNDGGISKLHIVTRDWSSLSGNVGSADYVISFAGLYSNNIPVVGNWDGLGGDDIGLFNPNTFYLYTLNPLNLGAPLTSRYKDVPFGMNGDKPFSGDWDNDGIDDLGMFRPQYPNSNTNSFFLDKGLTGNQAELGPYEYGNTGDIPVIGDWDGDGVDNIGVYRPSPGEFFKDTYDPIYEGAIVTSSTPNTPRWLLKNNVRQKITNNETFWIIYNSNDNRYYIFSDYDINKIPQGTDITNTGTVTLSVSPALGQQGTTFYYSGSGYTPNGIVEWRVRKPDGVEYLPDDLSGKVDGSGNFNYNYVSTCGNLVGDYTLWSFDKSTGRRSNDAIQTMTASSSCTSPPPSITLTSPAPDSYFDLSESITFSASVQGGLHPYDYKWKDENGVMIGTIASFSKSDFDAGAHRITLTVTDANLKMTSASVNVFVVKPFRFVQLTDVHIGYDPAWYQSCYDKLDRDLGRFSNYNYCDESYINSVNKLNAVIDSILQLSPKPDFVLITGDLVEWNKGNFFDMMASMVARLKQNHIDIYMVPGNHDRRGKENPINPFDVACPDSVYSCFNDLSNYRNKIGNVNNIEIVGDYKIGNYYFDHKGYRFIGLDSGYDFNTIEGNSLSEPVYDNTPEGSGLDAGPMNFLNSAAGFSGIDINSKIPKIVFMHHPAVNTKGEDDSSLESIYFPPVENKYPNYGGNDGTISWHRVDLIRLSEQRNIKLVLTGHSHNPKYLDSGGNSNTRNPLLDCKTDCSDFRLTQPDDDISIGLIPNKYPIFVQERSATKDDDSSHGYLVVNVEKNNIFLEDRIVIRKAAPYYTSNTFSPADVHFYDQFGRHTGLNATGQIETNIPDSYYFEEEKLGNITVPATILLYNTTLNYTTKIVSNFSKENITGEQSNFTFTMDKKIGNETITITYDNVSINRNTTTHLQLNSTETNYSMQVDFNNDTTNITPIAPDSIITNYAPTAIISSPANNSTWQQGEAVIFNGTGIDIEDGILNETTWISDRDDVIGHGNFTTTNLSAGIHRITMRVNDSAGQINTSSIVIIINDTMPPVLEISYPPENKTFNKQNITVIGIAYDDSGISNVTVNGIQAGQENWNISLELNEGENRIDVVATDNKGFSKTANRTVYYNSSLATDTQPPATITNLTHETGYNSVNGAWINWTWDNPKDIDFSYAIVHLDNISWGNTLRSYFNFTGLSNDADYNISILTADIVDNINYSEVKDTVRTPLLDVAPPQSINNPSLQEAGPTCLNFTWLNPPDPDFSHVMLYLNGTFINNIMAPQNYYDFAGLDPDTVYELGTHTVDIAGNINTSWINATARTSPLAATSGSIIGQAKYSNNGTGIAGITANLTNSSHIIVSVTTNSSGFYNFTGIAAGNYSVILSNAGLFGNSTNVVVSEGPTSIVNMLMWLKGDLNNNGEPADASDLLLMKRASIGLILGDFKFDLNNNGEPADASDLLLMKRASIGAIQLI